MKSNPIILAGLLSFCSAAPGQDIPVHTATASAGWVEKYRSGESALGDGRTAIALEQPQEVAKEAEAAGATDAQLAAVYDALGRAGMGSGHYRDGKRNFERALRH